MGLFDFLFSSGVSNSQKKAHRNAVAVGSHLQEMDYSHYCIICHPFCFHDTIIILYDILSFILFIILIHF